MKVSGNIFFIVLLRADTVLYMELLERVLIKHGGATGIPSRD
jgi:hypothetical protein